MKNALKIIVYTIAVLIWAATIPSFILGVIPIVFIAVFVNWILFFKDESFIKLFKEELHEWWDTYNLIEVLRTERKEKIQTKPQSTCSKYHDNTEEECTGITLGIIGLNCSKSIFEKREYFKQAKIITEANNER